ncbi:MAG: hypothetical protein J0H10_12780 [Alphaproteobacteria bacterium]|nr:hypothetical protein [Alphaproteobacteria bacterium]
MSASVDHHEMEESVRALVAIFRPLIGRLEKYSWDAGDQTQFWEWTRRSAVVKQHEEARAVIQMTEADCGHFGVAFLRSAYEELIWLQYLAENEVLANELAMLFSVNEVSEALDAQNQYLGLKGMNAVGFTQRFVKAYLARAREGNARLKHIGRKLGWRDGQMVPSAAFIARKVGREREYKFIYHATSRYVHFSPHDLLRRVWGDKGKVTITTANFTRYWTDFALYWSIRIFIETLVVSGLSWDDESLRDRSDSILEHISKLRPVEIITAAELESWPSNPRRHIS